MLNWEMVDPQAIYPRPRYRALSGKREYSLTPQIDSTGHTTKCWHLLMLEEAMLAEAPADAGFVQCYGDSLNCRSVDDAKRTAEQWEAQPGRLDDLIAGKPPSVTA